MTTLERIAYEIMGDLLERISFISLEAINFTYHPGHLLPKKYFTVTSPSSVAAFDNDMEMNNVVASNNKYFMVVFESGMVTKKIRISMVLSS